MLCMTPIHLSKYFWLQLKGKKDKLLLFLSQQLASRCERGTLQNSKIIIIIISKHLSAHLKFSMRLQREAKTLNNYIILGSCRLYNNHVKVTSNHVKVTGNHVMYDRGAWFLSVIMSSSCAFVLLSVSEEAKKWLKFFPFNV